VNRIDWTPKAVKQLGKLSPKHNAAVRAGVNKLSVFPETPNVKRLANHPYGYRLRVGNYRVLFDFEGAVKIVTIEEVKKRDEHTY
jgi:mRNA interferase RelE/StbE